MDIDEKSLEAIELLRNKEFITDKGMIEDLFLLVSSLVPLTNVDLLVCNKKNQILLSKRNDEFFEESWHIPGGCVHYGESLIECAHKTAIRELGEDVFIEQSPIAFRDVIRGPNDQQLHPRERGHNIAVLFKCKVNDSYAINNSGLNEDDNGYLRWFDCLPDSFMKIQNVYLDILEEWIK